jgi:nitric oxide reductase NorD protein
MADRSLWFESHLFAESAGRRARDACQRLGTAVHETILLAGDRLAHMSPAVAQQFYRSAPGVWEGLGADGFERWLQLGCDLLMYEPASRDGALAYFSAPPKAVANAGVERLTAWCATGRRLVAVSRRLGAIFFESTAAVLDKIAPATLAEWATQAVRLHGLAGWRGEFLAQAYCSAAAHVLAVLRRDDFAPWADLGAAVQSVLREHQYFTALPPGFARLTAAERPLFFATGLVLAQGDAGAAATFYTRLPAAVQPLPAPARLKVLQIFHAAAVAVPHELAELVPVVGALVHDIPRRHRQAALDGAAAAATAFPPGGAALLRSLPVAYEQAGHAAVQHWLTRGLAIASENRDAGVAYFALQSRTSTKVLHASSTAATLSDVQGLLRKYVQMLSGRAASIRGVVLFQLRSPLEEFPLENDVALPMKIDVFGTHEENCQLYRFLAAQLAGRREFGTYEADLPPEANGSLLAYLNWPQHPALLEDLFRLAEGFRVAAALARTYPGLAREQQILARRLLGRAHADEAPSQSALFDATFAWMLSGTGAMRPPVWTRTFAEVVAPCLAPLASSTATVNDALAAAHLLAGHLAATQPQHRPEGSPGDLFLDKVTGDALIGPYMDDDTPALPGEAPQMQTPKTSPMSLSDELRLQLDARADDTGGATSPLSAEELQRLLEAGADLRMKQGYSDDAEGLGLYITDLLGKVPPEQLEELRHLLSETARTDRPPPRRWIERRGAGAAFYYDEWDYHIGDYRERWCQLREIPLDGDSGEFFTRTLADYAQLIPEVRRQFQRIRPDMYRTVKGLEDGEDFDLNALVNARVDSRARRPPSPKLYVARTREERDVATLFLIDMSASTDEPLQVPSGADAPAALPRGARSVRSPQRIIDVTKEALVIMAEALEEIGDAYAIYGFSGHGRTNVEFYLVKSFNEPLSITVKGRIGALEPKRSTRMGTALRHATEKMAAISSKSRHIIMLSDGFPQDFDYGQDRRSNVYGLRDTTVALREAEAAGITPFCITVDKAGHDYLREMCDGSRYMVIEDIAALPRELPKIYQRVVCAATIWLSGEAAPR